MAARLIGVAVVLSLLGPALAQGSVVYVGDSLGVGTVPYLRQQLGEAIDADSKIGRPSSTGLDVLGSMIGPEDDVVVFDLGTNDDPAAPEQLSADLAGAREIAGSRCLVIATINRPPLNGVSDAGLNRAVTRFAARDPNVELADWRGVARERPNLLIDGIHATPDGYALRAQLFASAISSCLSFGGRSSSSTPTAPNPIPRPSPGTRPLGHGAQPAPEPAPASVSPRRSRKARSVDAVAADVATAVAVGADFG